MRENATRRSTQIGERETRSTAEEKHIRETGGHIHSHTVLTQKEKSSTINVSNGRAQVNPIKRIVKRLCRVEGQIQV